MKGFATILQKLVEYDFRKRYQSATEVQVDLAPIADQLAATEPAYGPVIVAPGAEPERPIDIEAATDETNMLPVNWFCRTYPGSGWLREDDGNFSFLPNASGWGMVDINGGNFLVGTEGAQRWLDVIVIAHSPKSPDSSGFNRS